MNVRINQSVIHCCVVYQREIMRCEGLPINRLAYVGEPINRLTYLIDIDSEESG